MTSRTGEMSATRAADRMRDAFEAVGRRDLDALASAWDDRTLGHVASLDLHVEGATALRALFTELFAAIGDLGFEVEAIHDVDEETAVGQWRLTGTFSGGPIMGIRATGRALDVRGIDVMTFDGPYVRFTEVYFDGLSLARQIGALPPDGSAADRFLRGAFNAVTGLTSAFRRDGDH